MRIYAPRSLTLRFHAKLVHHAETIAGWGPLRYSCMILRSSATSASIWICPIAIPRSIRAHASTSCSTSSPASVSCSRQKSEYESSSPRSCAFRPFALNSSSSGRFRFRGLRFFVHARLIYISFYYKNFKKPATGHFPSLIYTRNAECSVELLFTAGPLSIPWVISRVEGTAKR